MQRNNDLHGNVPDHYPVTLLLVDVLNDLDFPDAEKQLNNVYAKMHPGGRSLNLWCHLQTITLSLSQNIPRSTPHRVDTLLTYVRARTIIMAGLTTDACILTTACEIHIRDLDLYVPSDCVAASDQKLHHMAIELMKKSFGAHTATSRNIDLKLLCKRPEAG